MDYNITLYGFFSIINKNNNNKKWFKKNYKKNNDLTTFFLKLDLKILNYTIV